MVSLRQVATLVLRKPLIHPTTTDLTHPSRYYEGNTRRHVDSLEARITAVTNLIDLEEHYAQIGKSWKSTDVTDGEGKIILFQLFIVPEKDVNVLRMLGHHLLFNEQAFVSSSDWIMSPKSARNCKLQSNQSWDFAQDR